MYKILLEDGSDLLVSEKHKVYAQIENYEESNLDRTSDVVSDSTSPILSNLFSYDQNGHLYFNANATYGASFLCSLSSSSALGNNMMNSSIGMTLIFFSSKISNTSSSSLDKSAFDSISSLCRLISVNNLSGAIRSSLGENIKSSSLPPIKEEITMLASTTNNIYFNSSNFFLYALYNSSFTLLPIFNASFSESLDLATIALNNANSAAVSDIAFLAISDQFNSGMESISCFKSDGIANVSVGILNPPPAFNASNYVYYVLLYKPSGFDEDSSRDSNFSLMPVTDIYNNINNGKEVYFLDENKQPIKVKSITKQPYKGKIYDVDVGNWNNTEERTVTITGAPSAGKFAISDSSGAGMASIDNQGNMYLKKTKLESQSSLNPGANSFVIQNSSMDTITYIDSTAYLHLLGAVTESFDMSGMTNTNLEFRNSSDNLVAFFDNGGNLKLKGSLGENYANP